MPRILILYILLLLVTLNTYGQSSVDSGLEISFDEKTKPFSNSEKEQISNILTDSESKIRSLLPSLPKDIKVTVQNTSKDFAVNGGVNGRTERNSPAEVFIEISNVFEGGRTKAIETALASVVYHEFHHLSKGWAIQDNKYSIDIYTATVIEGLAIVFSEIYTDVHLPWNRYTDDVDQWAEEIIALPKNSNYSTWMFQHPDGRIGIGYKTGNFIVRKAMANSGITILELSKLSPKKIWKLAGY